MTAVTTCLWFDRDGMEAARFYTGLFPNSAIAGQSEAAADFPAGKAGDPLVVNFTLSGVPYMALNGHMDFPFTEAASIHVLCKDQAEVDRYWDALTADGGAESQCGWCKDRFGLSWQIVPERLPQLLADPDRGRAKRAMEAMLGMKKLDVAALERAADGG